MTTRVALVGNPNCGKTTLFNALTGSNQYVGNWPGVTVEKKEGRLKENKAVSIVDLPGIYSLSPYTLEEVVARTYLIDEKPDAILNIVDGTNLERNLYLTTQVLELGIPVVLAVNMIDVVNRRKDTISTEELSAQLGIPVVEVSALKGIGIDQVGKQIVALAQCPAAVEHPAVFDNDVERVLRMIETSLPDLAPATMKRFFAVKLFERDEKIIGRYGLSASLEAAIVAVEEAHDDDAESIITNGRYSYITSIIDGCRSRSAADGATSSDAIDRVVTNRWLALPIFAMVMFLVYFISVTTVGTWATDWANEGVFGEGWFLGAGQNEYGIVLDEYETAQADIEAYETAAEQAGLDPASPTFIGEARAGKVIASYESYDEEAGVATLVSVDAATYAADLAVEEPDPNTYGFWVPGVPVVLAFGLAAIGCADWLQALILDGIVAGVGAVLGFVPQLLVLFFLLAFLESCGYMSRIAFILDRIFRRFGLSGKSFVPILIGTGCGVPGIMASRTIENQNDRRMTVMTTTFIPCSAKLPIIALFAGAVFGGVWWVAPSAYFLGIAAILCSGIVLKKTKAFAGDPAPFVMELPSYHMPTPGALFRSMGERAWSFIKKAGTIILLATIVIWFVSGYGFTGGGFGAVANQNDSILAVLGGAIAWIFSPLGWGDWQAASATVTGLIAKENVVGTMGVLYGGDLGWYANVQAAFTPLAAYSFLAFNLLCAPCFAAMGAIRREMNSPAWFWGAIGYQCGLAYVVALWIYQIGGMVSGEVAFGPASIVALALAFAFLFLLVRPACKQKNLTAPVRAVDVQ
ncbi:MAG: ferrous iron transporter B [Raoultibacter sp.]